MFDIIYTEQLAPGIYRMDVQAPRVAQSAKPGQFVIVQLDDHSERIPLTIADYDASAGSVTVVIQAVGLSTDKLVVLGRGDALATFTGPLGRPSDMVSLPVERLRSRKMLFVGGGVGTAPVYPQVKWLHEQGIEADVIIGARDERMLIMIEQMRAVAGNLYIATDDGTAGFKGTVTALMKDLLDNHGKTYDEVVAIGPLVMMRAVAQLTREYDIPTIVSLNSLMVDGTGMCGACRVSVGGETKFTCVDGPEFDAHKVDFDEAMRRQSMYRAGEIEARAGGRGLEKHGVENHNCNCRKI